ncbi:hypothetical protein [Paenibacillus roseipurpureus]|uniref:Uncharacterized protein n=1 Tax=Paenibacillus roseopurpureus TaxID=2918901 RepID=A0AA96RL60_9BACL|nr:hypothetical protein [Paenibacillus sp. MBLB1832]WNR42787.1 hypothetical protein MJB10_16865 [Paenibacillus sp. MBLB1832]
MAGTYRETVAPANSGTSSNPITFQNYNNDIVTISGLDVVDQTGWVVDSGNIYKQSGVTYSLDLANVQLFVDGQEITLAQCPNKGRALATITTVGYPYIENASIPGGTMLGKVASSLPPVMTVGELSAGRLQAILQVTLG